jgi:hypothetical protein
MSLEKGRLARCKTVHFPLRSLCALVLIRQCRRQSLGNRRVASFHECLPPPLLPQDCWLIVCLETMFEMPPSRLDSDRV